ncbi:hypothetical protein H0H92_004119 [Tricholoma furcatifolium]|nr:hypothetical protein H0H92_004119 [Tricholoma furcatifolium]
MSKKTGKSAPKEVASYSERDIVLGKVRGFPPWPGMVVDPDSVPPAVQAERPVKKTNFYCVRFFPTGDYAWLIAKDMSKLQQVEIQAYINEPFKRSGDLLQGYKIALDPTAWEAERAADIAALAAEPSDDAEEGEDVDELASDDGAAKKGAKSKKRKRESSVSAKTRKQPKEKEKKEQAKSKAKKAPAKGRKSKSNAMVESEDERNGGDEDAEEDAEGEEISSGRKAASPPPAKKAKKEEDAEDGEWALMSISFRVVDSSPAAKLANDPDALKVRDWRHKLQKAFLSSKSTPDEAEMPNLDTLFSTVEAYDKMTVAYLQFSKIGKVMRHITLLDASKVPRDDEFRFKERAQALVERWQGVLGPANKKDKDVKEEDKKDVKVNGKAVNGEEAGAPAAEAPTGDANGTSEAVDAQGDAEMTGPTTDADAPGEADGEAGPEAEPEAAAGQTTEADAPGDADVPMAEA